MAVTQLKGSVFVHKASHLYYTPWVYSNSVWKPGTSTYDIVEILADSISIEQGDPTTETVDWEFGDTPLMSSSTKGERTITADCVDMSFDIMQRVFGWTREIDTSGTTPVDVMVSEAASAESYATIVITFHPISAPIIVLPKVSMSAKTTLGTFKTSTGSAQISGTATQGYIDYSNKNAETEIAYLNPIASQAISCANSATDAATAANLVAVGTVTAASNGEFYLN